MVIGNVQGHFYLIPSPTADVRCPACGGECRVYCSRPMPEEGASPASKCTRCGCMVPGTQPRKSVAQYRKCVQCKRTAKTRYVLQ